MEEFVEHQASQFKNYRTALKNIAEENDWDFIGQFALTVEGQKRMVDVFSDDGVLVSVCCIQASDVASAFRHAYSQDERDEVVARRALSAMLASPANAYSYMRVDLAYAAPDVTKDGHCVSVVHSKGVMRAFAPAEPIVAYA